MIAVYTIGQQTLPWVKSLEREVQSIKQSHPNASGRLRSSLELLHASLVKFQGDLVRSKRADSRIGPNETLKNLQVIAERCEMASLCVKAELPELRQKVQLMQQTTQNINNYNHQLKNELKPAEPDFHAQLQEIAKSDLTIETPEIDQAIEGL